MKQRDLGTEAGWKAHHDQHALTKKNNALMIRMDRKREKNRLANEKKADIAKKMYHEKRSQARKHFRDKGYTTVKEKGYYDYSIKERKNIRDNAKPNSNMRKWAGMDNSKLSGAYSGQ